MTKQFVIYTVQTGGYDNVNQPLVVDNRFDYVLFTDEANFSNLGIWQVRSIPFVNKDKTRLSRYPKMHPHELFPEYKASLYIDANVQIIGQRIYDRVAELAEQSIDWAGIKHPYRDCLYDEAFVIYGLDSEQNIFRWCRRLRQENYPRHRGMFENNVIFRAHNEITKRANDLWWNLYEQYTRRDQLTLMYVLWKTPEVKTTYILPEGESAWKSSTIHIYQHQDTAKQRGRRGIKESFWEHARNRCRGGMDEKVEQFREFHYWLYGINPIIAKVLLHIWGVYATVFFGAIIKLRAYKRHKKQTNE